MRKALLERFILVLLAALCINSVIFYIASSKMMLKNSKNDMTYTIKARQLQDYSARNRFWSVGVTYFF